MLREGTSCFDPQGVAPQHPQSALHRRNPDHPVDPVKKNFLCLLSLFPAKILIPADKSLRFALNSGIMHHVLRTKQHQKQGEYKTMPKQPPHHASSKPRWPKVSPDLSGNPILVYQVSNRRAHTPYFTKRTQFHKANSQKPTAKSCFYETNPISAAADLWKTKKHETNPISSHQYTFYNLQYTIQWPNLSPPTPRRLQLCETNPIPQGQQPPANSQKLLLRNEPNSPRPTAAITISLYTAGSYIGNEEGEMLGDCRSNES